MTSILGFLPTQQAGEPEGGNETSDEESRHKDIEMRDSELPRRRLQTFVFSATLTLPEGLRRRLKRGEPLIIPDQRLTRDQHLQNQGHAMSVFFRPALPAPPAEAIY